MHENGFNVSLLPGRELNSLRIAVETATSKAEVSAALRLHEVPEDDFVKGFPELA
jgi:hypothetical protein